MKKYIIALILLFALLSPLSEASATTKNQFDFTLSYVVNAGQVAGCTNLGPIDGCYIEKGKKMYINNVTVRPKEFVYYHEVGHHLFNNNFLTKLFKDKEIMADQFGLWMYHQKYGNYFYDVTKERADFFRKICKSDCVNKLINTKVPGMKYPIQSFTIRKP